MSSLGIGVDIENISRFISMANGKEKKLLEKIFSKKEIKYCFSKKNAAPHLAARFAGKEAVFKAVSSSLACNLRYNEIEIINNKNGIPSVFIKNAKISDVNITISLSHTNEFAIAFTILENNNKKVKF
jgi:holo-[acyl-carrier protein] synthase